MTPTITAFARSPDRGRGLARDMRVRWALEEVNQPYNVRLVEFSEMKEPSHRSLHPFGQICDADWLDGEFSAADLLMVTVLRRLEASGILDEYPNLSAYVARGAARPPYQRAFEAQLAVFTAASTG
jgi:glutathione S-transferase